MRESIHDGEQVNEFDYRSERTGAVVWREPGFEESARGQERTIARHLADFGYEVVLRARQNADGETTPDAWIVEGGERREAEFKRIGPDATNVERAIEAAARRGGHQARTVVVYVDRPEVETARAARSIAKHREVLRHRPRASY